MRKIKKEISAVGAIAPSGHASLKGPEDNINRKLVNNRKKNKGKLMITKDNNIKPEEFKRIKERIHALARNVIFERILNEGEQLEAVLSLYDNVTKQIDLSMKYSRVFIADGLKIGEDGLKFNMKRANAELKRAHGLLDDMGALLKKIHDASVQDGQEEEFMYDSDEIDADSSDELSRADTRYPDRKLTNNRRVNEGWTGADDLAAAYDKMSPQEKTAYHKRIEKLNRENRKKYGKPKKPVAKEASSKKISNGRRINEARTIRFYVDNPTEDPESLGRKIAKQANGTFKNILGPKAWKSGGDWQKFKNTIVIATDIDIKKAEMIKGVIDVEVVGR